MRITVVGCSGSFPGPDAPSSCYLVEHDGSRMLLDMGNGSLGALQRYTDIYGIDGVIISHLHVDHFIDLCSYYVALRYRPGGGVPPVPVWGPPGTAGRLTAAYGLGGASAMNGEMDFHVARDAFTVGPFSIRTAPVVHPVASRAIRVEAGGRSLTYSGDTGPTDVLTELAQGTDLALFEASFLSSRDNPPDLHLSGRQAAEHAAAARAGRLLLTHLVPWNDSDEVLAEAREVVGDAMLASPGLTLDI